MSRASLLLAAALGALAGVPGAAAEEADLLARFRKAFDPAAPAPAPDRVAAAGALGEVRGRAGPEAACRALGETLDRIEALAAERVALRAAYARLTEGVREGDAMTADYRSRVEALRAREEGLQDRDAVERTVEAALRALLPRFRDPAALDWLAGQGLRGSPKAGVRAAAAEALGASGDPARLRDLEGALRDRDAAVREAALAALARLREAAAEARRSLAAALDDPRWTTRLAAARALASMADPEAVDLLVARLPKEEGRLKSDVAGLLRALTGQAFEEPEGWTWWWKENRAAYAGGGKTLVPPGEGAPPPPAGEGEGVSYYGITTRSRRILYVIDVSGSMTKPGASSPDVPKVDEAKKELLRSIRTLEAGSAFTVFAFHDAVRKWKPGLVKATPEAREEARRWVEALDASAWTNTHAALEEALRASVADPRNSMGEDYGLAADTIFLLTDGSPTTPTGAVKDGAGRPVWPAVLEAVRGWNREKRVVIHAIGVGPAINAAFLSALASENGGTFVTVK